MGRFFFLCFLKTLAHFKKAVSFLVRWFLTSQRLTLWLHKQRFVFRNLPCLFDSTNRISFWNGFLSGEMVSHLTKAKSLFAQPALFVSKCLQHLFLKTRLCLWKHKVPHFIIPARGDHKLCAFVTSQSNLSARCSKYKQVLFQKKKKKKSILHCMRSTYSQFHFYTCSLQSNYPFDWCEVTFPF